MSAPRAARSRAPVLAGGVFLVHLALTVAAFFALFDSAFGPSGSWPAWTGSVAPPVLCALAAPVLLLGYALQLHAVLPLLAVLNSACWAWAVVALVRWRRKKRP